MSSLYALRRYYGTRKPIGSVLLKIGTLQACMDELKTLVSNTRGTRSVAELSKIGVRIEPFVVKGRIYGNGKH